MEQQRFVEMGNNSFYLELCGLDYATRPKDTCIRKKDGNKDVWLELVTPSILTGFGRMVQNRAQV